MPRVHTQKANKDYPAYGIKKGDTYYWWKFRYSGKVKSKTYPKASQLTQSSYLSQLYDLQDRINSFSTSDIDELQSFKDELISDIESMKEECEGNLENIPEQLREGNAGSILQERIDALDNAISEIEGIDLDDYEEPDEDDLRDELKDDVTYEPTEEEEENEDFDLDEKKKSLVTEEEIEEVKAEKLQEWIDEKLSELQNVSFE